MLIKDIEIKYPKAHDKYLTWMIKNHKGTYVPRIRFDFFDAEKIYIDVYVDDLGENFEAKSWSFDIDGEEPFFSNDAWDSRKDAEDGAYAKAFEILEERLNADNN